MRPRAFERRVGRGRSGLLLLCLTAVLLGLPASSVAAFPPTGGACAVEIVATFSAGGVDLTTPTPATCVLSEGDVATVSLTGRANEALGGCFAWVRLGRAALTIERPGEEPQTIDQLFLAATMTGGVIEMSLSKISGGATLVGNGAFAQDPDVVHACLPEAQLVTKWIGALTFST